ncbi:MAG TPA: hypothetical protein VH374_10665 [Polyangia bacterium]|jgi:hypothetical protein|nr:hypothetical protein [Polyangia bacterium]
MRRASKRWPVVVVLTLVLSAAAGLRAATKAPEFSAEVVVRIVDDADRDNEMSTEQLHDLIAEVVFSGPRLLGVIKRFGLSPRWAERDPSFAVADFRDAISLTVWQNDLISGAGIRHAARVSISYRSGVRERVLPVARGLADLLIDTEGKQRQASLKAQAANSSQAVKTAVAQANEARKIAADAVAAAGQGPPPITELNTLRAAEDRLRAVQAESVAVDYQLRQVAQGQTLRFEEVDPGHDPSEPPAKSITVLMTVLLAAAISFPVCLLFVGAFDPYVQNGDDVARAGIRVLGIVPGGAVQRDLAGDAEQPSV